MAQDRSGTVKYAMFGMDYRGAPVVASNVTTADAKALARSWHLNGYHLVPMDPDKKSRGTMSYVEVKPGHYETWEMFFWLEDNYEHAHWRPESVTEARKAERERSRGTSA